MPLDFLISLYGRRDEDLSILILCNNILLQAVAMPSITPVGVGRGTRCDFPFA